MMPGTARVSAPARTVATASWSLPFVALIVVGLLDRADWLRAPASLPPYAFAGATATIAAVALLLGVGILSSRQELDPRSRRRAFVGAVASAATIVVVAAAVVTGTKSGRRAQNDLDRAADAALREAPGWNGGAIFDGARAFAFEISASSDLAKMLLGSQSTPYRVVLFGLDNRLGGRRKILDLGAARLGHAGGAVATAALPSRPIAVEAGANVAGIPAFFAPDQSLFDVQWIEVRVDGEPRRLPGRYFSLDDKRAIDAARALAPR